MRLIGDVHGKAYKYLQIVEDCEESIQLGDMSFNYEFFDDFHISLDHKFFGGNHDNYNIIENIPNSLNDFDTMYLKCKHQSETQKLFYIRGAFSIDKKYRTKGFDWFEEEELSMDRLEEATELYKEWRPDIVLTHTCPSSIAKMIGSDYVLKQFGFDPDTFYTRTGATLQRMFEAHQPKQWYFGHFHKSWGADVNGCKFRCLAELEYVDI